MNCEKANVATKFTNKYMHPSFELNWDEGSSLKVVRIRVRERRPKTTRFEILGMGMYPYKIHILSSTDTGTSMGTQPGKSLPSLFSVQISFGQYFYFHVSLFISIRFNSAVLCKEET